MPEQTLDAPMLTLPAQNGMQSIKLPVLYVSCHGATFASSNSLGWSGNIWWPYRLDRSRAGGHGPWMRSFLHCTNGNPRSESNSARTVNCVSNRTIWFTYFQISTQPCLFHQLGALLSHPPESSWQECIWLTVLISHLQFRMSKFVRSPCFIM